MATNATKARLIHSANATLETGGHIRYEQVKFDCTSGSPYTWSASWAYPVDLLSGEMFGVAKPDGTEAAVTGDEFSSWVEGAVGFADGAAAVNDTVITVDASVALAFDVGDCVKFAGHATVYAVEGVDEVANTITLAGTGLDTAVVNDELIYLVRYFIGTAAAPILLGPLVRSHVWGQDTSDSTQVPPGFTFYIKYKNNQGADDKTIYGQLAYLY